MNKGRRPSPGLPIPDPARPKRRVVMEWVNGRYVTFLKTYSVSTPTYERCRVERLYSHGNYCEWPSCDLTIPAPRTRAVRILNDREDGL